MNQKTSNPSSIVLYLRLIKPLNILGALLVYMLGAGLARYLGPNLDWTVLWLGLGWIVAMQLGFNFLNEFFYTADNQTNERQNGITGSSGAVGEDRIPRRLVFLLALACLAVIASLTVVIIAKVKPEPMVYFFMALGFVFGLSYSAPPLNLAVSGYGELLASFIVAFLIPTFSFTLQSKDLHQLIPMVTAPLFAACLAMFITLEMEDYSADLKTEKLTLMVRIGWRNALNLHNLLLLTAYLLIGLATFFGLPRFAALAALFSLPIGLFTIWQIWQISQGGKPNWTALTISAMATFGSMAYLFTYAFWTH